MRVLTLPLTLITPLLLIGCDRSPAPSTSPATVQVQATRVEVQSISEIVSGGGTIYPLQQASLAPKVSSPVKSFYVKRGDPVRRGQLLAILENLDLAGAAVSAEGTLDQAKANLTKTASTSLPEQLQAAGLAVQNSQAALEAQQKLYNSYLFLYEQHAGARKDVDQAEVALTAAKNQAATSKKQLEDLQQSGKSEQMSAATGQVEVARGQMITAQAQLGYTRLRSPIAGVVADRSVYPGDIAQAGTPLITVMNVSSVIVRLHLPHSQSVLLKLGDSATIHIPGIEHGLPGKVSVLSPALDPNSTTVEVWVEAPNPDNTLQPGTSVQVDLVAKVVPDAIVIPLSAVLTDTAGTKSVMVVTTDSHAQSRPVTTGIENGGMVQVLSGLHSGEEIIASGAYGLPDGTKVQTTGASDAHPAAAQP